MSRGPHGWLLSRWEPLQGKQYLDGKEQKSAQTTTPVKRAPTADELHEEIGYLDCQGA